MRKGIWVADFCPLCLRKVVSDNALSEILKALSQNSLERALKIVYRVEEVTRFDILIPRDSEVIKILEGAPALYPLCRECARNARGREAGEKIEKNLSRNKHMLYKVEDFSLKHWTSRPRKEGCIF